MKKLLFFAAVLALGSACRQTAPRKAYKQDPYFSKGLSLMYQNSDSAFYYFNKVITTSRDSLQIAMSYNSMAIIQADAGDLFGGQESLLTSLRFLDPRKEINQSCLSSDYNELGLNSANLKNYNRALAFYDSASRIARDPNFKHIIANNKALVYQKKGDYARALQIYRQTIAQVAPNGGDYARILSNTARTKWLADHRYAAGPEMLTALRIRQKEKDDWGQNASYAHLADYYFPRRPDSAAFYAGQMYAVAQKLRSPDDQLEALQRLIRFGSVSTVPGYFAAYKRIDDSLQTARSAARNQFALIRYDAEKSKADNLKLQKDNTEKKYQLFKQSILLYTSIFLLLAGSLAAVLWYRKRKRRLEAAAQNAIRESQLRTSRKVHDVVANGLYRMMSEVENVEIVDREGLLDKIESLYERSRDLSYEATGADHTNFHERIARLLLSFATARTKVALVGNDAVFWNQVSSQAKHELEHVLQELMVNMRKHSSAAHVVVKFERLDQQCHIDYTDDGIGMPEDGIQNNGLTNTGNRIKAISGNIIFESKAGEGFRVGISFPPA